MTRALDEWTHPDRKCWFGDFEYGQLVWHSIALSNAIPRDLASCGVFSPWGTVEPAAVGDRARGLCDQLIQHAWPEHPTVNWMPVDMPDQ